MWKLISLKHLKINLMSFKNSKYKTFECEKNTFKHYTKINCVNTQQILQC